MLAAYPVGNSMVGSDSAGSTNGNNANAVFSVD